MMAASTLPFYVGWHDFAEQMRGDGVNGERGIAFMFLGVIIGILGAISVAKRR